MDNNASTLARFQALTVALQGRNNIPPELISSCKSQNTLAAMNIPSHGISPMSLNTLKKCANLTIEDGGWRRLDRLRRENSILAEKRDRQSLLSRSRSSKKNRKTKEAQLEETLSLERRYRIRLQVAYEELLTKVRSLAQSDQELANYVNRHATGFSLRRLSVSTGDSDEV